MGARVLLRLEKEYGESGKNKAHAAPISMLDLHKHCIGKWPADAVHTSIQRAEIITFYVQPSKLALLNLKMTNCEIFTCYSKQRVCVYTFHEGGGMSWLR